MDLVGSLQPILTGVLAVTTIVAAAFAGLMIGTQRTLRDSNTDLRARVTDLEQERSERDAKIAAIELIVTEREAENKLLSSMVQGRVDWTAIGDQLEEHHRQALLWWSKTEQHLSSIEKSLKGNRS
jgi:hypothetical protein